MSLPRVPTYVFALAWISSHSLQWIEMRVRWVPFLTTIVRSNNGKITFVNPVKRVWLLTCTIVCIFRTSAFGDALETRKRNWTLRLRNMDVTQRWRRPGPTARSSRSESCSSQHSTSYPICTSARRQRSTQPGRPPEIPGWAQLQDPAQRRDAQRDGHG